MKFPLYAILPVLLIAGCAEPESSRGAGSGTAKVPAEITFPAETAPAESVAQAAITTSFQAGETATLEVPKMHCPFVCYENVKDILEEIPGVEAVELVPQQEEGKIDDRRVTVKFDGEVEADKALAALASEDFAGSRFE